MVMTEDRPEKTEDRIPKDRRLICVGSMDSEICENRIDRTEQTEHTERPDLLATLDRCSYHPVVIELPILD